ncbi:MAG TPA: hypothetical protein VGA60_00690 [Kiloniellales bacterium]
MPCGYPNGTETVCRMQAGGICHAEPGDEHLAEPVGPARILVIERKGSVQAAHTDS